MKKYHVSVLRENGSKEGWVLDSDAPLDEAYEEARQMIIGKYRTLLVLEQGEPETEEMTTLKEM